MQPSGILLLNGVPGVFVMVGAVVVRTVGPVNGLVQVPEPGGVDADLLNFIYGR
jgi:hypothetical protein